MKSQQAKVFTIASGFLNERENPSGLDQFHKTSVFGRIAPQCYHLGRARFSHQPSEPNFFQCHCFTIHLSDAMEKKLEIPVETALGSVQLDFRNVAITHSQNLASTATGSGQDHAQFSLLLIKFTAHLHPIRPGSGTSHQFTERTGQFRLFDPSTVSRYGGDNAVHLHHNGTSASRFLCLKVFE
jgi:hypothetical protein